MDIAEYISKIEDCIKKLYCNILKQDPNYNITRKTIDVIKNDSWPKELKNKINQKKSITPHE